jgi:hypothetical protein
MALGIPIINPTVVATIASPSMLAVLAGQILAANGLARLNRFQVSIPTAVLVQNSSTISQAIQAEDEFPQTDGTDWMTDYASGSSDNYRLTAFCEKTELPGYQFQTDVHRIHGPSFKFPHMPEWSDVTMTFIVGADMEEKYFFDAWQFMVMDPGSNNFNYRSEYAVDVTIVSYDETNTDNYDITLVSAYPVSVSPIAYSYEDNNTIAKIQVTFTYKYGKPYEGASGSAAPRGQRQTFQSTISPVNTNTSNLPST